MLFRCSALIISHSPTSVFCVGKFRCSNTICLRVRLLSRSCDLKAFRYPRPEECHLEIQQPRFRGKPVRGIWLEIAFLEAETAVSFGLLNEHTQLRNSGASERAVRVEMTNRAAAWNVNY